MSYLLDTNVWVTYTRGKHAGLIARLNAKPFGDLFLDTTVLSELYYGAYHATPAYVATNLAIVDQLRFYFPRVSPNDTAAREYGQLREFLGSRGQLIGANDMLIAATALAHGLTLVTHNTTEFSRVPGLAIEDWQVP